MDQYAKLRILLRGMCRDSMEGKYPLLFQAEVKGVEGDSCTVDIAGLQLTDVRLKSVINGETEDVLLVVPPVGSKVLLGTLTGDYRDLAILSVERFERIILGGADFGGLVKATELTEKLNVLEKEINDLKSVLSGWTPVAQDGGAALKGAITAWSGSVLQTTRQTDIENSKITHG